LVVKALAQASKSVVERIRNQREQKYMEFFHSGGSDYPNILISNNIINIFSDIKHNF